MSNVDLSFLPVCSILSRATGYISAFDYTCNPYRGCSFACQYCYAAFFAGTRAKRETWGQWVEVKENAVDLLRRWGGRLAGKRIYMSSVTDPYQPLERRLCLTRSLLEVMVEHPPRLVVQTRGPLVTRDLDLLSRLRTVRVNMTITTDDDGVRKSFEPLCPSIERRLHAIAEVKAAGIKTGICLTPLLPVRDPDAFVERLLATRADVFVAQSFQPGSSPFAAGTRAQAFPTAQEYNWDHAAYERTVAALKAGLPHLYEGRAGFMPE